MNAESKETSAGLGSKRYPSSRYCLPNTPSSWTDICFHFSEQFDFGWDLSPRVRHPVLNHQLRYFSGRPQRRGFKTVIVRTILWISIPQQWGWMPRMGMPGRLPWLPCSHRDQLWLNHRLLKRSRKAVGSIEIWSCFRWNSVYNGRRIIGSYIVGIIVWCVADKTVKVQNCPSSIHIYSPQPSSGLCLLLSILSYFEINFNFFVASCQKILSAKLDWQKMEKIRDKHEPI